MSISIAMISIGSHCIWLWLIFVQQYYFESGLMFNATNNLNYSSVHVVRSAYYNDIVCREKFKRKQKKGERTFIKRHTRKQQIENEENKKQRMTIRVSCPVSVIIQCNHFLQIVFFYILFLTMFHTIQFYFADLIRQSQVVFTHLFVPV